MDSKKNQQTMSKNIQLPLADFELAVALKDVGFDVPTERLYKNREVSLFSRSRVLVDFNHDGYDNYSAPDLYTVATWLREVHGVYPVAIPQMVQERWTYIIYKVISGDYELYSTSPVFLSHDSALLAACKYAVEKIKDKI